MRFGNLLFSVLIAISLPVFAEGGSPEQNQEWRKWASQIVKQTEADKKKFLSENKESFDEWLVPSKEELDVFKEENEKIFTKTVNTFRESQGIGESQEECLGSRCFDINGDILRVFVSFGMPESELIDLFQEAAVYKGNVKFHIRGVDPVSRSIDGTIRRAVNIWKKARIKERFSFTFAPDLFTEFGVASVPMMVFERKDRVLLTARGYTDFDYFEEKAQLAKESGEIGVYGTQVDVIEKHLMDDLKERMEKLDVEEKLKKKVANYLGDRGFGGLTYAKKDRYWKFDPSITLNKDVVLPNGVVVRKKGDVLNPMDKFPYSEAVIIADLTNPKQFKFVKDVILPLASDKAIITLMTTQFKAEKGWKWLAKIEDELGLPVYEVDKRLVDVFGFKGVPALATSAQLHFDVREYGEKTWDIKGDDDE